MTMPILQNRYYTLSVAGTMGRNSVVAMLGNYMVIGRLKNNIITFKITDFTEEDTIVLICPEGGSITHAQLERGNKATDWTPAPEDTEAAYIAVKSIADGAASSASTANSLLTDIASDSKLTATEKKAAKKEWDIIVGEKPKIDSSANTYGITTQKTAYNTAYNALNTYLSSLLANLNTTSNIVGTTFRANFKAYYDARQDLLNEIADGAKSLVDNIDIGGRNLIVIHTSIPNTYISENNGLPTSSTAGARSTGWIEVNPSTDYIFNVPTLSGQYFDIGYFDNNKTFIKRDRFTGVSKEVITTTSNTYYIRVSHPNLMQAKLEKGNKATDWTPAPEDVQAELDSRPTFHDFDETDKVTINGGNIKAGTISSKNNYSKINLDDGTFKFANGDIEYNGTKLTIKKGVEFGALPTDTQTKINDGAAAKTLTNNWVEPGTTKINGSNILTGTLSAGTITTGTLSANKGTSTLNMDTGDMVMNGNFNLGSGAIQWNKATKILSINANSLKIGSYDAASKNDVSAAVNEIEIGGENLFAVTNTVAGYESSGNITTSSEVHRIMSNLVDIGNTKSLIYQVWNPNKVTNTSNSNRVAFFTEANVYISSLAIPQLNGSNYQTHKINVPTNARKARLSAIMGVGTIDPLIKIKLEKGNKATDWTPAPEDVQAEIDSRPTFQDFNKTNMVTINGGNIKAGTISSKNNYSRINLDDGTFSFGNGRLVWNGSDMTVNGKISVSNINGDIPKSKLASTVQTEISAGATAKNTLDSKSSTWDAKETTSGAQAKANTAEANAKELASAMAFGKMLYTDPTFKYGNNSVKVYNNSSGTGVTIDRIAKQQNAPTDSTHILRVTTSTATTSPGLGGFTFQTMTSANKTYITRFIAKIPSGRSLIFASNALGSGGNHTSKWLSSNKGTGRWEEYVYKVIAGETGSFSSTNFFYIEGGSKPLTWYIAYATVFDVTDDNLIAYKTDAWSWSGGVEIDGGKIRAETIKSNQIAAGSITADKIVMGTGTPSSGNLAAGRTFSGSYSGTIPGNGNNTVGTNYASFGAGGSNNNQAESAYIQVDLGSIRQIAESRIFWYASDRRRYYYKIKYSTNGSTWFYAIGNSNNNGWTISKHPSSGSSGSYEPTIDRFSIPITARYLRIYGNGSTSNTGNHIYEWELYSKIQTTISGGDIVTNNLSSVSANLGTVTAGIIRSSNSRNEINLNNGNFSLGNGQITYNNSTDVVSISAKNIDLKGKVNFDAFDSQLKTTVNNKVTISDIGTSGKVEIHGGNIKADSLDVGKITGDKAKFLSLSFESLNSNMQLSSGAIRIQNSAGDFATMNTIPEFRSQDSAGTAAIMGKGRSHYYSGNQNRFYIGSNLDGLPQYGVHIGKKQTWGIYRPTDTSGGAPAQYYNTPRGWGAVQVIEELMRRGLVSNNFNTAAAHIRSLNGWGNSWPVLQPGEPVMYKAAVAGNSSGVERIWTMGTSSNGSTRVYSHVFHAFEGGTSGTSDRRLKHDIEPTQVEALAHIESLSFKEFKWNKDNRYEPLGLIAQDSGIIRVPDEEMEGYDIQRAIMLGLKGVQELQEIVKEQAEEIKRLKEILNQ